MWQYQGRLSRRNARAWGYHAYTVRTVRPPLVGMPARESRQAETHAPAKLASHALCVHLPSMYLSCS